MKMLSQYSVYSVVADVLEYLETGGKGCDIYYGDKYADHFDSTLRRAIDCAVKTDGTAFAEAVGSHLRSALPHHIVTVILHHNRYISVECVPI